MILVLHSSTMRSSGTNSLNSVKKIKFLIHCNIFVIFVIFVTFLYFSVPLYFSVLFVVCNLQFFSFFSTVTNNEASKCRKLLSCTYSWNRNRVIESYIICVALRCMNISLHDALPWWVNELHFFALFALSALSAL